MDGETHSTVWSKLGSFFSGKSSEDHLEQAIREAREDGELKAEEGSMLLSILSLDELQVQDIMTPRTDIDCLPSGTTILEAAGAIVETGHSRLPVYKETRDNIIGIVYLKDLFSKIDDEKFNIKDVASAPHFLPENMSVYTAMERLRNGNQRYGLVTDEFGSIEGIVTISDILGALVGTASSGPSSDIITRDDGSCLIDGQCSFYDFLDHYDMTDRYQEFNYNTLSGLILDLLQHIPTEGEKIEWLCFSFEIVDMDGARIDKVLVHKHEEPKPEE